MTDLPLAEEELRRKMLERRRRELRELTEQRKTVREWLRERELKRRK